MGQRRSEEQSPFRCSELWLCEEAVPEAPRKLLELVEEAGAGPCRRNLPRPCGAAAHVAALMQMRAIWMQMLQVSAPSRGKGRAKS
jgi:hypothetical protein